MDSRENMNSALWELVSEGFCVALEWLLSLLSAGH